MITATQAWLKKLREINTNGVVENTRGMETKELLNQTLEFSMDYPIIYHPERKLNYQFMAAEAEFIANGDNRVSSLARYNKNIAQFSDDGRIFNGNYGDPFNSQLEYVVRTLIDHEESRQAVLTIFQPNPVKSKDIRCTLSMQFLIRDGFINTVVNMRSSDIVWGIGYDVFNFTIMTLRVLTRYHEELKKKVGIIIPDNIVRLGTMYINAGSSHLYERHYELADTILNMVYNTSDRVSVPDRALIDWKYVADSLYMCKEGTHDPLLWDLNPNRLVS